MSPHTNQLEDALATIDQWFLPTDDGHFELYVREEGSGGPVVVVHGGFGIEHSELVEPMSALAGDRRVIWYDQRGSIRSPYSTQEQLESITFDTHVADLVALLREVRTESGPADVIAHSMGTVLAMTVMAQAPELMNRVVLIGAIPPVSRTDDDPAVVAAQQWLAARDQQAQARIKDLGLDRDDLSAKEQHLRWRISFAAVNAVNEEAWLTLSWPGRAFYREIVADMSVRGMPHGPDLASGVRSFPRPVNVILGDQDYIDFGAAAWRGVVTESPQLSLHVIPDCGHSPWYDQPEPFRTILTGVLLDEDQSTEAGA